jgi:hypothetical protein
VWIFGGLGINTTTELTSLDDTPAVIGDFWEYDEAANEWTWLGGGPLAAEGNSGIYGTLGVSSKANLPGARTGAAAWTDAGGTLWLYGGYGIDGDGNVGFLTDLWMFNPQNSQWAWMGGASTTDSTNTSPYVPVYGVRGTASAANSPGFRPDATTWTDSNGMLWLFGGWGIYDFDYYFNDLWMLNPNTARWTWVDGPNTYTCAEPPSGYCGQVGKDGSVGIPAASNIPRSRSGATGWADSGGNLWLFAGLDGTNLANSLNDLWKFETSTSALLTADTPTFSLASGTYNGTQQVGITDLTPGAVIHYTTDGSTPNIRSAAYSGPLSVSASETVSVIGTAPGYNNSSIASAAYVIQILPADFSISSSVPSLSVAAGQSGTLQLTVTPSNGFASATTFACSELPAGATCSFSPSSVTPSGGPAKTTLTITTSETTGLVWPVRSPLLPAVAGCVIIICRRRLRSRFLYVALALIVSCVFGTLGCGGGGGTSSSGQPVKATVVVTATSGSLQHSINVQLTVN